MIIDIILPNIMHMFKPLETRLNPFFSKVLKQEDSFSLCFKKKRGIKNT